jgi:NitT/TauT family transport system substrate-binding protein
MRKKNFAFMFIAALAVNFSAFSVNEKIVLAIGYIPHIQFAPLYAGIQKGIYSKYGIDLSIQYGFGIDIFSLLDNEKIDLGLSDSDQLIIAGSKNVKIGTVFQYYQKYPVSIVALEGKIKSPSDLSGKTIGTPELYGTSYIGLKEFQGKFNLNDIKIAKIGYTQMQSLISGQADAVVCFSNNEPVLLRLSGKKIVQWNVADFSDLPGASFISGEKIMNKKKELLKKFFDATREAIEWTVKNQQQALELSKKYIQGYDESQNQFNIACLKETSSLFENKNGFGYTDIAKYNKSIEKLYDLKLIDHKFDAKSITYDF